MARGSLALGLHAHLPFVRHPEHEDFLEERWFYEAVTETYVPLLEMLEGLDRDRVPCRLTISLSPTLLGMLADRLLRARYLRHLDRLVELAEKEERRTRGDGPFHRTAELYLARFYRVRAIFLDEWQQDLVAAFRTYQEHGLIDVITCAATSASLSTTSTCAPPCPLPASAFTPASSTIASRARRIRRSRTTPSGPGPAPRPTPTTSSTAGSGRWTGWRATWSVPPSSSAR